MRSVTAASETDRKDEDATALALVVGPVLVLSRPRSSSRGVFDGDGGSRGAADGSPTTSTGA